MKIDHLTQQQRPPVAKLRNESSELVTGVGLRQRYRSVGSLITRKDSGSFFRIERIGIQAQFLSQCTVDLDEGRSRYLHRLPGNIEAFEFAGKRIVKWESNGAGIVRNLCHDVP